AGATMNEVVASIRRVTDIMGEISAASSEQSSGVSQIGEAVTQMDQATQQNAALVEQMAAAANSLRSQAQDLVQAVAVFRLDTGSAHTKPPASMPSAHSSFAGERRPAGVAATTADSAIGIDLDGAIKAHADWRSKLRSASMHGEHVDVDTVCRDDRCPLGRWLHGNGRGRYAAKPSFAELVNAHRSFHEEAGKVARVINEGEGIRAEKMLDSDTPFAQASQQVTRLIVQLKGEINDRSTRPALSDARRQWAPAPTVAHPAATEGDWTSF
ncbi:MAG: CZB domain-containing protein, partial [Hylemonella sp.]|uniref:methyl-accepting chemotaxis protein n=1 Tax=Hylemonella sp. TaxID=2066020 RepID=UPI003918D158